MQGRVIAITGKGGTGKTILSALMIGILLKEANLRILAIDADSAISLPHALGMKINKTVGEIRQEIIENPEARRSIANKHIRTGIADAVEHGNGFDLLVMGRLEGPGCFCAVNDLLRYGIETLSKEFDVTLIDGEAGPEQINRRVLQGVDTLIVITDTSVRGFQAAGVIKKIALDSGAAKLGERGLVINRLKGDSESVKEAAKQIGLEVFGCIPEDENITNYDLTGKPIIDLPETSPSVIAVQGILKKIGIL